MTIFLIALTLLIALFLETSFLSFPLVLVVLILLAVLFKKEWIFLAAFIVGILFDSLSLQSIGISSVFFCVILGALFLYQRKYEIQSIPFVGIFTAIASLLFLRLTSGELLFLQSVVSGIFTAVVFFLIAVFSQKQTRHRLIS